MENSIEPLKAICIAIIGLPLLAAIITGLFNKRLSKTLAHRFTISAVGISFFLSCYLFKTLAFDNHAPLNTTLYTWGSVGTLHFQLGFLLDRLSALMMMVVSFVSWMVHIYTIGYMKEDSGYQRFFSYIALFTFSMLMLVSANNFLQLFFGWEAVGLMSYLLIGFWFQRESAICANLKAFLINRIGDFGFILGIAAVFYYFGTLDYENVFAKVPELNNQNPILSIAGYEVSGITLICVCLFMGAMGKSAQIPLHVWLPDSMEGPTPISALIHAATMVTAGVFMLARLSPIYEYSETALNLVLLIGTLTCVLMGLLGIVQSDIKRIIAYSTLSQLGYMMTAMGVSAYSVGIFHLMTHAFFKALLFLGAGSVIVALHHEQNIWKMGGLRKYLPITYWTMLIGSLAMVGVPFFSGFYSKDLIIEAVHFSELPGATFAYWGVLGSVFVTALYTFRLFFVVFHTQERMDLRHPIREPVWVITLPLIVLAIPSIVAGAIFVKPLLDGFFGNSISIHPIHVSLARLHDEFHGLWAMGLHGFLQWPFWLALAGFFTALIAYVWYPNLPKFFQKHLLIFYFALKQKYGFDALYDFIAKIGAQGLGLLFWRLGDQWVIDGVAVNGTAHTVGRLAKGLRKLQSGYLYHYAFAMITGFLLLLVWLVL